jgi:hypothetical protein
MCESDSRSPGLFATVIGGIGVSVPLGSTSLLRQLDASVGASGPHGFAVRGGVIRPRAHARLTSPRPPHPAPNVRDVRETPLYSGRDGLRSEGDLRRKERGNF